NQKSNSELGVADTDSILQHRCEHRLQIAWRPGNDLQYFGHGSLLLQRLGEFAGAPLLRLEEPGVLDRDYRLVSEGLDQLDLLFSHTLHKRRNLLCPSNGFTCHARKCSCRADNGYHGSSPSKQTDQRLSLRLQLLQQRLRLSKETQTPVEIGKTNILDQRRRIKRQRELIARIESDGSSDLVAEAVRILGEMEQGLAQMRPTTPPR